MMDLVKHSSSVMVFHVSTFATGYIEKTRCTLSHLEYNRETVKTILHAYINYPRFGLGECNYVSFLVHFHNAIDLEVDFNKIIPQTIGFCNHSFKICVWQRVTRQPC